MGSQGRSHYGLYYCGLNLSLIALILLPITSVLAIPTVEVVDAPISVREPGPNLQSSWKFNCYSNGQACNGDTGNTRGGSSSTVGCSPIDNRGCTQYSFNRGGQFKLCLYSDRNCQAPFESVNSGSVSCIVLGTTPRSWKVVLRDHTCDP